MKQQEITVEGVNLDELIGRRVHHLMWDRRVTQTTLGRAIGMDQSSIAKRLRGRLAWSSSHLVQTARALDTTVAYLVAETEDPRRGGGDMERLPELDSNQQPAGIQPRLAEVIVLRPSTQLPRIPMPRLA